MPMRDPRFQFYGRPLRLQPKASYRLRVTLEAPDFRRWGRQSERFASPAEVVFEDVSMSPEERNPEQRKPEEHKAEKPKSGTAP